MGGWLLAGSVFLVGLFTAFCAFGARLLFLLAGTNDTDKRDL
jgi:hypothetical protein